MLEDLKKEVYKANMMLTEHNLAPFTWGNVSGYDIESGIMAIKPSGVDYKSLSAEDMVLVSVETGEVVEGKLKPSSDTPTHIVIYKNFEGIGGVAHTHSRIATSFAQAGMGISPLGTTHADNFYGEIPCTRLLDTCEINGNYEEETGKVIIETFNKINPITIPGVLVHSHGPFSWGKSACEAAFNAVVMEEISIMNLCTIFLNTNVCHIQKELLDRHYLRKHGNNAYYGQK